MVTFRVLQQFQIFLGLIGLFSLLIIILIWHGFIFYKTHEMWVRSFLSFSIRLNQFEVEIKRFWSNNVRDYFNKFLSPFFQKKGIIHESSYVSTSQQNEVTKKKNDHFLLATKVFLFQKINIPKNYWGDMVLPLHIL